MPKSNSTKRDESSATIRTVVSEVLSGNPSEGFVSKFLPELWACRGVDQMTRHHASDVYAHSLAVYRAGILLFETGKSSKEKPWEFHLASLVHDVGKPKQFSEMRKHEPGSDGFRDAKAEFSHDKVGRAMVPAIAERLRLDERTKEYLAFMVGNHLDPALRLKTFYEEGLPTEKSLRKAFRHLLSEAGGNWRYVRDLVDFAICDGLGSGTVDRDRIRASWKAVSDAFETFRKEETAFSKKDLAFDGRDAMEAGFSGKSVGLLLDAMEKEVVEGRVENSREALKRFASGWKASST